ncbi:MAG: PDZ domain-containing protein, partial [Firmicutes bacterium]|nr:PDZ domain-containing protein [Bacillota bacterium]
MVEISKRTIVFLVIAALLIGSVGTILILRHGAGGNVMMSEDEYEELTAFKEEYEKLDEIKWFLSNHYYTEVDETKLMESAYYGLVDGLGDKYSGYISADDYADYLQSLFGTGTYYGVGLTFLNDPVESGYYVMAVNTKGPAYALGARKGDIIVSVDGVSALTMNGDELRDSIRGELGTTVTVGLLRGDSVIELT